MRFTFDPAKDAENRAKHGLSFEDFTDFDDEPIAVIDRRSEYGELRIQIFGFIDGKPHCVVATPRDGGWRFISFRRARIKELRRVQSRR